MPLEGGHSSPLTLLPEDYYRRMYEVEERHWWHQGMRCIAAALLADRPNTPDQRVLDAGCGTGGFLRWLTRRRSFRVAFGVDISPEAIELARQRVPEADLRVAALRKLPFDEGSFDLVVLNDVLQHIHEDEIDVSLAEIRRVLTPQGTLLIRTNGDRRARRERSDWRIYDRPELSATLERAGFRCERLTYANLVASLWAAARGRSPRAPTETEHGIPGLGSPRQNWIALRLLLLEAWYLRQARRRLPFGHTLFAVATVSPTQSAAIPRAE
jgi:SAM-dependent methyltransferase